MMNLIKAGVQRILEPLVHLVGRETYAPHVIGRGKKIDLIRVKHFDKLPDGTVLTMVTGEKVVKGRDVIHRNNDLVGFMAYGFPSIAEDMRVYTGKRRSQ